MEAVKTLLCGASDQGGRLPYRDGKGGDAIEHSLEQINAENREFFSAPVLGRLLFILTRYDALPRHIFESQTRSQGCTMADTVPPTLRNKSELEPETPSRDSEKIVASPSST